MLACIKLLSRLCGRHCKHLVGAAAVRCPGRQVPPQLGGQLAGEARGRQVHLHNLQAPQPGQARLQAASAAELPGGQHDAEGRGVHRPPVRPAGGCQRAAAAGQLTRIHQSQGKGICLVQGVLRGAL